MITFIVLFFGAYLIGSVSSAVITCRLMGYPDPRTEGSKNPGATNVLRLAGKVPAMITMAGDVLKGVIPVMLVKHFVVMDYMSLGFVACAAFWGHLYPIFFRFQGGKGVATALGAVFALHWPLGLAFAGVWLATALITRISSLSSLTASVALPLLGFWLAPYYVIPLAVMTVFLVVRHKENIQRLMAGTESKIGDKKKSAAEDNAKT